MIPAGNSDANSVNNEDHEDSQKIKVPDPSMDDEQKEKPEIIEASSEGDDTTMMEGAWADILGSGQLKKKVSFKLVQIRTSSFHQHQLFASCRLYKKEHQIPDQRPMKFAPLKYLDSL